MTTALAGPDPYKITGARVDERRVEKALHVDLANPKASDEGPGSANLPLKTLGKAVELAMQLNTRRTGVKILVHPGTYRESVSLQYHGKETDTPIVIEALEQGTVTVSGSDLWDDWKPGNDTGTYTHAWPYKWGLAPYPPTWEEYVVLQPIVRRREMIFVNGRKLKQVLRPEELAEGCFYVSEEKERATIRPWAGVDVGAATVEVAVRERLLAALGKSNVIVRGIIFQHSNRPVNSGAVGFSRCRNVLIENCQVRWNNWAGFGFSVCKNVTARRLKLNHNGGSGGMGHKSSNVLWEDAEHSYNNWRGHRGGFHGWAVGGCKFMLINGGIFRRTTSIGNQCHGFWFDYENSNILVEEANWSHNLTDGIFIEANRGPITIRKSIMAFNGRGAITSTNSERVTLEDNILYGNGRFQIWAGGKESRRVANPMTGDDLHLTVRDWTLRNNVIVGVNATQDALDFNGWRHFLDTLRASGNLYFNPAKRDVFTVSGLSMNLDAWQNATGQDLDALFADPRLEQPEEMKWTPKADSPIHKRSSWTKRSAPAGGPAALRAIQVQAIKDGWTRAYPLAAGTADDAWFPINLRPAVNNPLSGREGIVGWGLDHFPPGRKQIHGVPFDVLDQEREGGNSVIALRSLKSKLAGAKPTPQEVMLPVGRKLRAVYVLHACGWALKHVKIGAYDLVYEDGRTHATDLVSYGSGSEHLAVSQRLATDSNIQDWWPTQRQFQNENARHISVIDLDAPLSYRRFVYSLQIENPHPDRVVKALRLASRPDVEAALYIIGVTGALK